MLGALGARRATPPPPRCGRRRWRREACTSSHPEPVASARRGHRRRAAPPPRRAAASSTRCSCSSSRWASCPCVPPRSTSYSRAARSWSSTRSRIQLDKARSLSAAGRDLPEEPAVRRPSAIARTLEVDVAAGQFSARVARIRERDGLEALRRRDQQLRVRERGGHPPAPGARSGVQLREPDHRAAPRGGRAAAACRASRWSAIPLISTSLQEPVIVLAEPVQPGRRRRAGRGAGGGQPRPPVEQTSEMGQEGLFDVYVVDGRGRLVAHSDPDAPARETSTSRGRDRPPVRASPQGARRRHRPLHRATRRRGR